MFARPRRPTNLSDAWLLEVGRWLLDRQRAGRNGDLPCPPSCGCLAPQWYTDQEIVDALRQGRWPVPCTLMVRAVRGDDPNLELAGPPYGADRIVRPVPQGRLSPQARYLAVPIRNASPYAFARDLVLEISVPGQAELARYRAFVRDSWTSGDLLATGQQLNGTGIDVGGLDAGAERTVYFPVDTRDCRSGAAEVEFVVRPAGAGNEPRAAAVTGTVQVWAPPPAGAVVVVAPAVSVLRAEASGPAQASNAVRSARVQAP